MLIKNLYNRRTLCNVWSGASEKRVEQKEQPANQVVRVSPLPLVNKIHNATAWQYTNFAQKVALKRIRVAGKPAKKL
ncbi:MAG: hypothetical protein CBB68_12215 [Rhodospirillaceae bacterium TMED8]|nr:MAG: hypothetical protein CBB68_12215 [Rhodospirillaceae bacterium TMED8]